MTKCENCQRYNSGTCSKDLNKKECNYIEINPTLEQVKQEWEKEGFEIISCSKERFEVYKNWIEKGFHSSAKVVIDKYLYIVGEFSNKYIELLTKTFKALGRYE